ncbi:hypothetical protein HF086_017256 [Spodoptera exigua]|uniref:Uncharacterized protein n=1 Tax=Spodoptera exigua TaxID=7107 RepID=A0A922MDR4_SPOEX|nr:hypothetical protein HF086_006194 [Spodoptera exigua]KAH9643475.1 hypothetical protein HF086_017256 [Spodoptera exigua]
MPSHMRPGRMSMTHSALRVPRLAAFTFPPPAQRTNQERPRPAPAGGAARATGESEPLFTEHWTGIHVNYCRGALSL